MMYMINNINQIFRNYLTHIVKQKIWIKWSPYLKIKESNVSNIIQHQKIQLVFMLPHYKFQKMENN